MLKLIARWVVPGLFVVLGGTAVTVMATETSITDDLQSRAAAQLSAQGVNWAEIRFDARDALLVGTTDSAAKLDAAQTELSQLYGVRSVRTQVDIAPLAAPYQFSAQITDGVIALAGGVPNVATRDELIASAGAARDALELRSGLPAHSAWRQGADFAIDKLRLLDQGKIELNNLTLNVSGRARSERAYGEFLAALNQAVPSGITLGKTSVAPPLASPYEWSAESDGKKIAVSGYVPSEQLADEIRVADVAGMPVATGLSLASGAPENFEANTQLLLKNLARLRHGTATIIDGHRTLTGAPADAHIAQIISDELVPTGTIVVLEPPEVSDYRIAASLDADGQLKFDGFAPDELTRERLGKIANANTADLKLGRGAPERFDSALDFGLSAVEKMSSGTFELRSNAIILQGIARSMKDYTFLQNLEKDGAPQGFKLAQVTVAAPVAAPYIWQATKSDDGGIGLSGYVPNAKSQSAISARISNLASDTTTFASGEPKAFTSAALTGLALLDGLKSGNLAYDGTGWSLSGQTDDADALKTFKAAIAAQIEIADWSVAVTGPQPPSVSPYVWSGVLKPDGAMAYSGYLPNAGLQRYLANKAGDDLVDGTKIAAGAPVEFVASVTAGMDALLQLDSGELKFDGARWSLTGVAAADIHDKLLSDLAGQAKVAAWTVDIAAPVPEVVRGPYVWSATRSADGVTLAGSVPTESLQKFAAVRAGTVVADATILDPDAPEGFAENVLAALDALSKLNTGTVSFDGSNWMIAGELAPGSDKAAVVSVLQAATTPADRWTLELTAKPVQVEEAGQVPPAPEPVLAPDYAFDASRDAAGVVSMVGAAPAAPARLYFGAITGAPVDGLEIKTGAPADFIHSAEIGLRGLMRLSEGDLHFSNGQWALSGKVADQADGDAVTAMIAALPNGADWSLALSTPPAIDVCRAAVAAFDQNYAILFQSGAALIATASDAALTELARDLAMCPDTAVQIEGHTDSDGDDAQNLALSVARAEAVVDALVSRNILAARLYAVGFGESKPIASNDTADGKRQNRRIIVQILDQHY